MDCLNGWSVKHIGEGGLEGISAILYYTCVGGAARVLSALFGELKFQFLNFELTDLLTR